MRIGVTGGKGGTGKTFFAVNLALSLEKLGATVSYLDCDVDCPSSHLVMGIERQGKEAVKSPVPVFDEGKCQRCGRCAESCQFNAIYCLQDGTPKLVERMCNGCGACVIACPHGAISEREKVIGHTYAGEALGIRIFSGELVPSEPLSDKIVHAVRKRGNVDADFSIIDTAAGAHCPVVRALEGCEKAFVVTEPTAFGKHDLEVIAHVLRDRDIPYEVVMNRSDIGKESEVNAGISIPYDREVLESYVRGKPLVNGWPENAISKKFQEIAGGLVE